MTAAKKTKPKFLIVEDTLKCQTEAGELSLSLKVKFGVVRGLMKVSGDTASEMEFFMDKVLDQEAVAILDELDAAEAAEVLSEFGDALAVRMGARLGESGSSSN